MLGDGSQLLGYSVTFYCPIKRAEGLIFPTACIMGAEGFMTGTITVLNEPIFLNGENM